MSEKVAFVGAGCVGKTTLIECLQSETTGRDDVAFVGEAAREYFANHDVPEAERFGFAVQSDIQALALANEEEAESRDPSLIYCDRSVLDAPIYVTAHGDEAGGKKLLERVRFWLPSYTRIYLLNPAGIPHITDAERLEGEDVRQKLHDTFVDFFTLHNIAYKLLSGQLEERLRTVREVL